MLKAFAYDIAEQLYKLPRENFKKAAEEIIVPILADVALKFYLLGLSSTAIAISAVLLLQK